MQRGRHAGRQRACQRCSASGRHSRVAQGHAEGPGQLQSRAPKEMRRARGAVPRRGLLDWSCAAVWVKKLLLRAALPAVQGVAAWVVQAPWRWPWVSLRGSWGALWSWWWWWWRQLMAWTVAPRVLLAWERAMLHAAQLVVGMSP